MSELLLIETLRYEPTIGFVRLGCHLARLARSARTLGFPDTRHAADRLKGAVMGASIPLRVRLTFGPRGDIAITIAPAPPPPAAGSWRVAIARTRLSSRDPMLRHKTTRRTPYEKAWVERAIRNADEMILLNEHGAVCEGTITTVFVDDGSGTLRTPPLSCGLLAGALRSSLLASGRARVSRLTAKDLETDGLFVGNSLRGLIPAMLVPERVAEQPAGNSRKVHNPRR